MNNDVATLQNIADTLKEDPLASQRVLAENAGMSIGLMNAVLKRFAERGWIMLTNVNLRKLSYAITPAGISELTKRSRTFAKRTFGSAESFRSLLAAFHGLLGGLLRPERLFSGRHHQESGGNNE